VGERTDKNKSFRSESGREGIKGVKKSRSFQPIGSKKHRGGLQLLKKGH